MANEYVITLINDTGAGTGEQKAVASNKSDDGTQKNDAKLPKQLGGLAMYGYARNIISKGIQSRINTVSLRTGHEELQQKQQLAYNIANQSIDIATSIIIGAKTGGAVGAAIGAVLSLGSKAIDYGIRTNEINIARQQENMSQFLNQIRIGAGGGRLGRIE